MDFFVDMDERAQGIEQLVERMVLIGTDGIDELIEKGCGTGEDDAPAKNGQERLFFDGYSHADLPAIVAPQAAIFKHQKKVQVAMWRWDNMYLMGKYWLKELNQVFQLL